MSELPLVLMGVVLVVGMCLVPRSACAQSEESKETPPLPFLDYRSYEAYARLRPIEPTGYFAVGRRYIHAPRVEWEPVEGAIRYNIHLVQGDRVLGVTQVSASPAYATAGWNAVTVGKAGVIIEGYAGDGTRIALSRLFPIYVAPDYDAEMAAKGRRGYLEAAMRSFDALYNFEFRPDEAVERTGPFAKMRPVVRTAIILSDGRVDHRSFPNLHDWLYVEMCEKLLPRVSGGDRERVLHMARSAADHLLLCRLPDDYACAGMIRGCADAQGGPALGYADAEGAFAEKMRRVVEPGKMGHAAEALVKVFEMTGERSYLDAAVEMAEFHVRTQRPDGSWPARLDGLTGEVLGDYSTSAGGVASFMDRLDRHVPDARWRTTRDRAVAWMLEHPMKTFAWVVNFDDYDVEATASDPFKGLSNWDLFHFIRYLCGHPDILPDTAGAIREQLEWNDNHFCFYGSDPLFPYEPHYPVCAEQGNPGSYDFESRIWIPMDFHTSNWGLAQIAYGRLTGDERAMEVARAAANALTQYQLDNGYTITWMGDKTFGVSALFAGRDQTFWPAATAMCVALWAELADEDVHRENP